jgi:hypothetical protein
MKNIRPVSLGLPLVLAIAIGLASCGSPLNPSPVNTAPATLAYVFGVASGQMVMMEYSTAPANSGASVGSLQAGQGPIATDAAGQIYVAGASPVDPLNLGEILVYPPNSTGNASPSRTIDLSFFPNRIAVDPTGRVYVANLPAAWTTSAPTTVSVYAADASGAAPPIRTFVLTDMCPTISDMVADAAGNLYVADCNRGAWVIAVYPPTANGPSTPARTIDFGADTLFVYGVAVDSAGHIFANISFNTVGTPAFIQEFAHGASGPATPINTINLTGGPLGQTNAGGPVRVDGAGNIFTSLQLWVPATGQLVNVFYGFGPDATGDAVPTVQFAPPEGGTNGWIALN